MSGYKKNLNTEQNIAVGEFDNYSSRLNDNVEEKLYTSKSSFWHAFCLSGYSVNSTSKENKMFANFNPPEIVDLGDGISRYKVRVQIINKINSGILSPTACFANSQGLMSESQMQFSINYMYPFAYTEDLSQVPIYGSMLLIEEFGTTKFIRQQVSRTGEE